ncbi:deoxynucleoside kinase [Tribolium castaneum]|uniref:Deoxynucleoside kinase-like Protein n=1 Tax=Tribolium castaneum TaxID=7070 RepID=D6W7M5_TRICA|nr:PREDICTED: deoxynucleoside kinase [Tribolium castaneum]EFA11257.1 Deoxynucleoside kinase-like Protein [Tribolium castaneum]|eukprot:XP_971882.1 PREDICTED: deoxynucleoside kinase [Tribolium castaneum]
MNTDYLKRSPLKQFASLRPYTVIVEGNIGCGKTTFLNYFQQFDDVNVLAEPVNKWRNCNGYNLLDKMYSDPKKWSFTFQSYVQLTILQHHTMKTGHPIKLMERSIYSARHCFVEQMARNGSIERASVSVMDEWFKWAKENCDLSVDLIVYLKTTPETAYQRMLARNRPEEQYVPLEYFQDIHNLHEEWLLQKRFECPAPVLIIDANLDKSGIMEEYSKCKAQIFTERELKVAL